MEKILINTGAIFCIIFILVWLGIPASKSTAHSVLSSQDYETMKLRYTHETNREYKENIVWSFTCFLAGSGITLILLRYITKRKKTQQINSTD